MNGLRGRSWRLAAVLGLGLSLSSGCQTVFPETGQTLPSGDYLHHLPQYFPPTPPYPLPKEQYNLDQAVARDPNALLRPVQPLGGGPGGP